MSNGTLFVSFAESDGGHSYLATRAMLDPSQIAHLVYRSTVSEALDALAAGQSNYAVVPFYNSITQWEGATVKALSSGLYEIFGQACLPTSYVLVAHRDHIDLAAGLFAQERGEAIPMDDEKKVEIYRRLITHVYVGRQADEQYRGRLLRPDMAKVSVELTRNPVRVLEDISKTDLLKALARGQTPQPQPLPQSVSGGTIQGFGNFGFGPPPPLKDFQGPAALVAEGLKNAPGDNDLWSKTGSLGEVVSLLGKLFVLLNVHSFGAPDLPANKTLYLLLGRKGSDRPRVDSLHKAKEAPWRTMVLMRPKAKGGGPAAWLEPRKELLERTNSLHIVYDRPPLMIAPGGKALYLQEGARVRTLLPHGDIDKVGKQLKEKVEKKASPGMFGSTPSRLDASYLGIYPTWCDDESCKGWLCEPVGPVAAAKETKPFELPPLLKEYGGRIAAVVAVVALSAAAISYGVSACEGSDSQWCTLKFDNPFQITWPSTTPEAAPPPPASDVAQTSEEPEPPPGETAPAADTGAPSDVTTRPAVYPGLTPAPSTSGAPAPVAAPPPPPEPAIRIAFPEGSASPTGQSLSLLRNGAMKAMETDRLVLMHVDSLVERENDSALWRQRLQAVRDELVRLGVPRDRIVHDGSGPYDVIIRPTLMPETRIGREQASKDIIPDPMWEEGQ